MNKQDWINAGILTGTIVAVGLTFKIGYDYMNQKIKNEKQNQDSSTIFETETPVPTYEIEIPNSPMPFEIEFLNPKNDLVVHGIIHANDMTKNEIAEELSKHSMEEFESMVPEATTFNSGIQLSDYDRWYTEAIVAGEAGWEPIEGKMAVAQCLYNAMTQDQISIQEVRTRYGYQGWHENFGLTNAEEYESVREAVSRVFDNGESVTDENIMFFYNPDNGYSSFHEGLKYVTTISHHKFFAPWN